MGQRCGRRFCTQFSYRLLHALLELLLTLNRKTKRYRALLSAELLIARFMIAKNILLPSKKTRKLAIVVLTRRGKTCASQ